MKKKLNGILTLLLVFMVQLTFAQERTVTGTVSDSEGLPLPGVNIIIKDTNSGTQTDFDGNYTLRARAGDILVFTFVGYAKNEIAVGGARVINATLDVDAAALDEVVIQGYRSSTKEKSSIASVTITSESIENRPNANFVQTLSGQVAGLNISTSSGQPGASSNINLRGVTSINGNTQPLFIIDGIPVDEGNFRSLNPQDIASISVLKDAGATAIYGNRGANGVVIIETRQGSFNSPLKMTATSILSFNTLQDADYDLLNSQEQLELTRTFGNGRGNDLTDAEIAAAPTTDWLDVFFRTGITKNNTLSLSAGGEKSTVFTSLGFFETEGILKGSDLKRFNVRNNITGRSDDKKFTYGTNVSLNYSKSNEPNAIGGSGINQNFVLGAFQSAPYITPEDYTSGLELTQGLTFLNTPLFLMDKLMNFTRFDEELKILASANAGYKITDDFSANATLSSDYTNEVFTSADRSDSFNAILFGGGANPLAGFQAQQTRRVFTFNQVTSLNYNKTFGDHTIDAGVYTEYFKAHLRSFGYNADGIDLKTFSPGDGAGFVDDNSDNDFFTDQANATIRNAGLFSYFSQVDYDYATTYGITGTVRRDASYRFAESNRWATFYSVAARWNINNEAFMANSIFDVLKLRASYGTAGNQTISGSSYFSAPDLTRNFFGTGGGYAGQNSIFLTQIANNTLRWETVTQANIGIDFEVFNRRLRGSVDGYVKETTDLFQSTPISAINAITLLNANTGTLTNTGVDVSLKYDIIRGGQDGFNMDMFFTGNYNKQELGDIPREGGELIGTGRNGGKLFEYYTIRYAGVNPANGNLLFLTADGDVTENPNADTDRVWLDKNIFPDYNGGFGLNMSYNGFFIQTQFNYVIGVDRYDFDLSGFQSPNNIAQFRNSRDILRAWTPDNRVTDIPALRATNLAGVTSDRYLRNADFLRLRFASFGYNLPKDALDSIGIASLRLFANGENLFTLSEWRGFDAEALSNTSRIYPTPRIISVGVEIGL
ncbi:SusC/RagA family TonB-linked outer membrane protein [Gillisia hiemivivida]|uniref:SusC/RagA family TonB-linked outer membrane protein n=1 Tax=Gillisia hiemivivida TaxID=291190 RepID=A0A5C6ZRG4_9FLAO|nr:SusC/RagA family TonB-linked outer membrane protein [Gillisia hiemivivida]TXD92984.1 SusC/RagA family TonB-linked outer membrane protein [Gillisia hiemivivida]